ncbi:MAG: tetratricopeptide repeat protein [Magnetococcus sp. XQGC-1]
MAVTKIILDVVSILKKPRWIIGFVSAVVGLSLLDKLVQAKVPVLAEVHGYRILADVVYYIFIAVLAAMLLAFVVKPLMAGRDKPAVVTLNVNELVEKLLSAQKEKDRAQEQVKSLTEAVTALQLEKGPGVQDALAKLGQGDTTAAVQLFRDVKERKASQGKASLKEAAEAARHEGALAFLSDTQTALTAYRQAVEYDPDNVAGWNQLGHLLYRTGALAQAEESYRRVLNLGETKQDKEAIAIAYGNLGILYQTRGELDRAEEMYKMSLLIDELLDRREGMANQYGNLGLLYQTCGDLDRAEGMYKKSLAINESLGRKEGMARSYGNQGILYETRGELDRAEGMYRKSLAINESLGHKEGMANQYGNLGNLYGTRGELDRAEEMYRKSLAINESLGHKEGMANQYGNLGLLCQTRGELDRAEAFYRKSIELFRQLGVPHMVAKTQGLLDALPVVGDSRNG